MLRDTKKIIPDIVVAGAPKCGTSAMIALLLNHPQVSEMSMKEPNFFSTTEGVVNSKLGKYGPNFSGKYHKGLTWYRKVFKDNSKVCIDGSTLYFINQESPELIKKHSPDAKIIIMLRDPAERIFSHYLQDHKLGFEFPDFDDFIRKDHPKFLFYKEISRYQKNIKRFEQIFKQDQILIVTLESFKTNPSIVMDKILVFTGLDNSISFNFSKNYNPRTIPRFAFITRFISYLREFGVRNSVPTPLRKIFGFFFRVLRKVNAKKTDAKLSKAQYDFLIKDFKKEAAFVQELSNSLLYEEL
ncbi:MAG: sulfotransferase [Cyclobacteriaceae bacterium]